MNASLAEIQAQARKAARGAGASWGLAEDIGRAVRWLEARGLPGVTALAGLLAVQGGLAYETLRPVSLDGVWRAQGGALCPVIAGVTLADHRFTTPPTLGRVRYPLLLLPYLCDCGLTHPALGGVRADAEADLSASPLVQGPLDVPPPSAASRPVDAAAWAALDRFSHRTYVPASDASRAGAGAGQTDND